MPNTSGKYSVPEEIRRLKPRGTMVKKINGHFYVYGMKNTKDPTTGKWKTVTTGILGKITLEDGYVPNEDAGYTVLEYGAYHLAEECAAGIRSQFSQAFGKGENARKIWALALIYAVNGFRAISSISTLYRKSALAVVFPDLKMGETAVANLLDFLGRRDTESLEFQRLLQAETTQIALDGHAIPRYSMLDGMTEFGYKYRKFESMQVNLLTAYDVARNRPVSMKMFDGSKNDRAAAKEMIRDISSEGCLFLMDRGFHSPGLKEALAAKNDTYIMPVSSNMNKYREAMNRGRGRLKSFVYLRREGIRSVRCAVEYRVSSDEDGTRVIYFHNLQEAADEQANYLACIEKQIPGYTAENLPEAEKSFGVAVMETTFNATPEEIYSLYKKRWGVETYFDYLKHQMDFNALGVQDWAKLQGLAFMMLLATLIRGAIQEKLKQASFPASMPEVLLIASSIKAIKRNLTWNVENCSKRERELFGAIGISVGHELTPALSKDPT